MSITSKESTPPLTLGKMGPYTVFVTSTATQFPQQFSLAPPPSHPVQAPPQQFQKLPAATHSPSEYLRNLVARVRKAHSSLDECVAHWLGLNQSKYQWALDDYCESKGMDQVSTKAKDMS